MIFLSVTSCAERRVSRLRSKGFTLIELLVAIALMSVLAAISWRGIDGILNARDRLTTVSDDLKSMSIAFGQLDEDFRRTWAMRELVKNVRSIQVVSAANNQIEIELLREGGGALDPVRAERVRYRLQSGQYQRGFAAFTVGATAQLAQMQWQPLLGGVKSVDYRVFIKGRGWIESGATLVATLAALSNVSPSGTPPSGTPPNPTGSGAEILGVEVSLARETGEVYKRLYSVRD